MDPYRVLGVDQTASREAIEAAYQGRLQQYGHGSVDAWVWGEEEEKTAMPLLSLVSVEEE